MNNHRKFSFSFISTQKLTSFLVSSIEHIPEICVGVEDFMEKIENAVCREGGGMEPWRFTQLEKWIVNFLSLWIQHCLEPHPDCISEVKEYHSRLRWHDSFPQDHER